MTTKTISASNTVDYKFPDALLKRPKCFIALAGLDARNNAVHRLVWHEFTSGGRRAERKPILYINFSADHIYPKCCQNRTTYEDYSPVGILKTSWLQKHTEELPALVVFFFDLDWNDAQWDERQTECASKIEVIRSALENRATEIVMVLLQKGPPVPAGDAASGHSEKASMLCAACELPTLNLFVLPFTQRPQGFITRIEEALYKKAIVYYRNRVHTTKAHKDMITNKQALHLLSIRHQFKMAFFSEMKQEKSEALKFYQGAYNYLLENMYLSEDRVMEFKMVAGFFNYKICQLSFEQDEPLTAITQFRKHIDLFSKETGPKPLLFENAEWLSRQFSVFADLFSEAVKRGLRGLQSQNPGIYYHQAALYALERKQLGNKLGLEAARNTSQLLPSLPATTYYGQRPWRVGLTDSMPSNMELRQKCIFKMQALEFGVDHSWQIIPLLTNAVEQFKSYHSERIITFLKMLLADEYYHVKNYENSLVLLNALLEVYRREQWWAVLAHVLKTILRCSYLLGNIQFYFKTALELTGRYSSIPVEEKKRIQQNVIAMFEGHTPSPEPGIDGTSLGDANERWINPEKREFTVQVSTLAACVECKTVFSQSSFRADQPVELTVYLCSSAPLSFSLSCLKVIFNDEVYTSCCVIEERFKLEPNVVKHFVFSFPVNQNSVDNTITVEAIEAVFGSSSECPSTLVWSNGVSGSFSSKPPPLSWQKLHLLNSTVILPRVANAELSLSHQTPALTGEYYAIDVVVSNKEQRKISELVVSLTLPESLDETQPLSELYDAPPSPTNSLTSSVSSSDQQRQSLELICEQLEAGERFQDKVYVCAHGVGSRKMDVNLSYNIRCKVDERWEEVECACQKMHSETLQITKPFDLAYKLMNMRFKPTDYVLYDEPFVLVTEIHCTSPWQLHIAASQFHPTKNIREMKSDVSQIEGLELDPGDKATECLCLVLPKSHHLPTVTVAAATHNVSLGTFTIKWRRASDPLFHDLSSTVTFPPVAAKSQIFTMSADIPASGQLQEVMPVSYTVYNKTSTVQEFEAKMGISEAFMFSGNRQSHFRILPNSNYTLTFNLYPVLTGLITLPSLEILCQREGHKGLDPVISSALPTTVFVKPPPTLQI